MSTVLGAWVPGCPLVLSHEKSPQWHELHNAYTRLGKKVAELKPDVLVVHSSQWLSVLGTSFQTQPNPKGLHVDENWYEWGDLPFNFKCDTELSEAFAKGVSRPGFPTKTVNFEEFPIDTGTIVLMNYLNPDGKIPVSIVSTWVYADHEKATQIGTMMQEVLNSQKKKSVVVASSLLSTRYFTDEIDPKQDKISNPKDDEWNQKILKAFEAGDLSAAAMLARDFVAAAPTDMQLNALHWLRGMLKGETWKGKVLGYGPQWGTGAAVVEFERG